ncbi:unnamed protein product, partial [Amoebophrya sp. A25]|eukprot:GSA25T00011730001.1
MQAAADAQLGALRSQVAKIHGELEGAIRIQDEAESLAKLHAKMETKQRLEKLKRELVDMRNAVICTANLEEARRRLAREGLNASQFHAVMNVISTGGVFTVQGPPGTGKTRMVATLARALLEWAPLTRNPGLPVCLSEAQYEEQELAVTWSAEQWVEKYNEGQAKGALTLSDVDPWAEDPWADAPRGVSSAKAPSPGTTTSSDPLEFQAWEQPNDLRIHAEWLGIGGRVGSLVPRRVILTAASNKAVFNMMEKIVGHLEEHVASSAVYQSRPLAFDDEDNRMSSCISEEGIVCGITFQGVEEKVPPGLLPFFLHTRYRDIFEVEHVSDEAVKRLIADAPNFCSASKLNVKTLKEWREAQRKFHQQELELWKEAAREGGKKGKQQKKKTLSFGGHLAQVLGLQGKQLGKKDDLESEILRNARFIFSTLTCLGRGALLKALAPPGRGTRREEDPDQDLRSSFQRQFFTHCNPADFADAKRDDTATSGSIAGFKFEDAALSDQES